MTSCKLFINPPEPPKTICENIFPKFGPWFFLYKKRFFAPSFRALFQYFQHIFVLKVFANKYTIMLLQILLSAPALVSLPKPPKEVCSFGFFFVKDALFFQGFIF